MGGCLHGQACVGEGACVRRAWVLNFGIEVRASLGGAAFVTEIFIYVHNLLNIFYYYIIFVENGRLNERK
jgi:hypothetical protein